MNITVLVDRKIGKNYIKDGIKEYSKRLTRYCKTKLIEVKHSKDIEKKMPKNTYCIHVDSSGESFSSEKLSSFMDELTVRGNSNVTFVIADEAVPESDYTMRISKMDIDRELSVMILLEQIYRGFRISRGEPYHK